MLLYDEMKECHIAPLSRGDDGVGARLEVVKHGVGRDVIGEHNPVAPEPIGSVSFHSPYYVALGVKVVIANQEDWRARSENWARAICNSEIEWPH